MPDAVIGHVHSAGDIHIQALALWVQLQQLEVAIDLVGLVILDGLINDLDNHFAHRTNNDGDVYKRQV